MLQIQVGVKFHTVMIPPPSAVHLAHTHSYVQDQTGLWFGVQELRREGDCGKAGRGVPFTNSRSSFSSK